MSAGAPAAGAARRVRRRPHLRHRLRGPAHPQRQRPGDRGAVRPGRRRVLRPAQQVRRLPGRRRRQAGLQRRQHAAPHPALLQGVLRHRRRRGARSAPSRCCWCRGRSRRSSAVSALMPAFIISTSYTPYLQGAVRPRRVPVRARALHGAQPRRVGDARGRGGVAARVGAARVRPAGHRVPGGGDDRRRRATPAAARPRTPACRAARRGAAPMRPSSGSPTRTRPRSASWTACSGRRCRSVPSARRSPSPSLRSAAARSSPRSRQIVAAEGVEGGGVMYVGDSHHGHAAARGRQGLGRRLAELQRQRLRHRRGGVRRREPERRGAGAAGRGVRGRRPGRRRGRRPLVAEAQEGHARRAAGRGPPWASSPRSARSSPRPPPPRG